MNERIPLYQPDLTGNERKYVLECLDSTWISSKGEFIERFEAQFAQYVGVSHAAGVCNGTVGLHLALVALGVGPGDEVIVPTLTYVASVNAIVYTGATPVFVDSLPDTWQMDPADVARKITSRTKAIMPVHLYGLPCAMDALMALAREHGLKVVEDCAEAIGTKFQGRHVGSFGDVGVFSFFGNKTITTGEGGMVVMNDAALCDHAKHLRGQGLARHREYFHDLLGFNYRMTNICAALGVAQLERVEEFLSRKRRLAQMYRQELVSAPLQWHVEPAGTVHSHWMISATLPTRALREDFREHLAAHGIETRPFFCPAHTMPIHARPGARFPVAEQLSNRGLNLPSWPGLSDAQMQRVCGVIRQFFSTRPELAFETLNPRLEGALADFFKRLSEDSSGHFFHPHPLTEVAARERCAYTGKDFYCALREGDRVIAYGMLRGWDEGYAIPSLGIAIDSAARGRGLSRMIFEHLHREARARGASKVRTKIHRDNAASLQAHLGAGYAFVAPEGENCIGFFALKDAPEKKP